MRDAFIEILGQPWFAQATAFLGIVIAAVGGFLFKRRLFGIMERIARNIETRERANEKSRSEPVSTNGPAEAPGTVERTAPAAERRPAKAPYPRARVAQRPFDDGAGAGITNRQRLTEGFDILTKLLALYVAGELRERFDGEWWSRGVLGVLHNTRNLPRSGEDEKLIATLDIHCCLTLMDAQWKEWFQRKLGRKPRSWVNELIAARNEWAHKGSLDTADDDAWRVLDTMVRLAERTSPGERADTRTIERLRALVREASPGAPGVAGRSVPPAERRRSVPPVRSAKFTQRQFDDELLRLLREEKEKGKNVATVVSKELHRRVVPRSATHRMPMACVSMWKLWEKQGRRKGNIVRTTPSGRSSTIEIRYDLADIQ